MALSFFVAGTDTSVGKTRVCTRLLSAANNAGLSTLALKPIAAGADKYMLEDGSTVWQNDDALALQASMSAELAYEEVNPLCFRVPASPHISAEEVGQAIDIDQLLKQCKRTLAHSCDLALIEGAGGWRVPISPNHTMADLAKRLDAPVILVVGMRLGCLNHALLSAEAIVADGLELVGWVANELERDMPFLAKNIDTLLDRMPCPLLAKLPFESDVLLSPRHRYTNIVSKEERNVLDINRFFDCVLT